MPCRWTLLAPAQLHAKREQSKIANERFMPPPLSSSVPESHQSIHRWNPGRWPHSRPASSGTKLVSFQPAQSQGLRGRLNQRRRLICHVSRRGNNLLFMVDNRVFVVNDRLHFLAVDPCEERGTKKRSAKPRNEQKDSGDVRSIRKQCKLEILLFGKSVV